MESTFQKQLMLFLFVSLFFLLPWYYTASGQAQPVDVVIFCAIFAFFTMQFPSIKHYYHHSSIFRVFLIFSIYTTIILLMNYIIELKDITLFLSLQNVYFVFLVIIFLCMLSYFKAIYSFKNYYKLILVLLIIDTFIPLLYLTKAGIGQQRIALSFNNENQLGFYALVNFTIFYYVTLIAQEKGAKILKVYSLYILNMNLLFLFLAASRACYPCIIMYILSYPMIFKLKTKGYTRIFMAAFTAMLILIGLSTLSLKLYHYMSYARLSMMPTTFAGIFSDFHIRALNGIEYNLNDWWYFLFGNGTYKNEARGSLEFHNNFLATFNIIGSVGLIIYSYMNFLIARDLYKKGLYYLVPFFCYLFYSMLHYSYRTRVNWILLALMIFVAMEPTLRVLERSKKRRVA